MKADWSSTFPGYWAADHLRAWAAERLEEVKAQDYDKARVAMLSESWKNGVELSVVPEEVIEAYDICVRTARIALRKVPPEPDKAVSSLMSAHGLVTP
jgi:hypothetical protein